eukprot:symbB.v1.2.023219.t1/scaffold2110.1/size89058/7
MICRTEAAPLSARLPRAAGAHSIELPPGHRGLWWYAQHSPQVLCWAFAMHLPRSLPQKCRCVISNFGQREACQVSSPVVGATHPYPGVRSWQPRAF